MFPAESNAGSPERCYPPSVAVLRARWLLAVAQGLHLPYNCTCPITAPVAAPVPDLHLAFGSTEPGRPFQALGCSEAVAVPAA